MLMSVGFAVITGGSSLFSTQHCPLRAMRRATSSWDPRPDGVPRKLGSEMLDVDQDAAHNDREQIRVVHFRWDIGEPLWQYLGVWCQLSRVTRTQLYSLHSGKTVDLMTTL